MADLDRAAEYLLGNVVHDFLRDGKSPRLPMTGAGSDVSKEVTEAITKDYKVIVLAGARPDASTNWAAKQFNFTHGWLGQRWCSTYLLLDAILTKPKADGPLITVLPKEFVFAWPDEIPEPTAKANYVDTVNELFPWVALGTFLHEIGHQTEGRKGKGGVTIELECDAFAARYLIGKKRHEATDILTLSLAVWLCCVCSEGLANKVAHGVTHPNPVDRLLAFLTRFVPQTTDTEKAIWTACATHVMRLTIVHVRPDLEEKVLRQKHENWETLLKDLSLCWK